MSLIQGNGRWGCGRRKGRRNPSILGERSIALAWVDKNVFPFQRYLKATCDFSPPPTCMSSFLLNNLFGIKWLDFKIPFQNICTIITLFNMFSDTISKAYHVWILPCFDPKVGAWLMARPIFPTFKLFSLIISTLFQTRFILPHPSITSLPQCVCTHPIDLLVFTSCVVPMAKNAQNSRNIFTTFRKKLPFIVKSLLRFSLVMLHQKNSKQNTSWCVLQYFFNKFYDATKVTTIHKKVCPNI
jgi:hypothetical protein